MKKPIDDKYDSLEVMLAGNGFLVRAGQWARSGEGFYGAMWVAATPTELARLVQEWAEKKNDAQ